MKHYVFRLAICGILIVTGSCTSQPFPALTPTAVYLTSTVRPPIDVSPSFETALLPTQFPTAISPELISSIDTWLKQIARDAGFSGSVLIAYKDHVLLSNGYGLADREHNIPNTAQTRFRLGSITKQFTAMAILILEAQGKLSVEDLIFNYLTDCPPVWKNITIDNLLTHTSGIPDYTRFPDYRNSMATPSSPTQTMARFEDLPLDFNPGEKWSYSNSGYIVLGYIIEQVSGQTYEDFLKQSIFIPLKLNNTGYDHNSNDLAVGYADRYSDLPFDFIDMSIPYAAGALFSTIEDLYNWDQALDTERLIPQAYLDKIFTPHVPIPNTEGWFYGYGWNIGQERGHPIILHGGSINGFVGLNARYPDDQITIIVLSNQQSTDVVLIQEILSKKIFGDD